MTTKLTTNYDAESNTLNVEKNNNGHEHLCSILVKYDLILRNDAQVNALESS